MPIEEIDPTEAKRRQDAGWTYVDVRSPEEFAAGHPVGAVNVPIKVRGPHGELVFEPGFLEAMKQFAPTTPLLLGCKTGGRSMTAAEMLQQVGYTTLVNVDGGFVGKPGQPGWQELGLPSE